MRVVCIQESWCYTVGSVVIIIQDGPQKDQIYNVVGQSLIDGKVYFTLAEFPSKHKFNSDGFRPIDENFANNICEKIELEIQEKQFV